MRSLDDRTIPPFRNAFTPSFLQRLGERDEPPPLGGAGPAGPWQIEEVSGGGFGVFRFGQSSARGFRPYAICATRPLALLAAAVLTGTGREAAFRLQKVAGPTGYTVTKGDGEAIGHLQFLDERLVDALNILDRLLQTPTALAGVLEAAGAVTLEQAGAILGGRFFAAGD